MKVLIIKISAVGDVFMAMPHIEAIAKHYAGKEIWILTGPALKNVFKSHPHIKTKIINSSKLFGDMSTRACSRWIRQMKFNAVFDLQGNRLSTKLVACSKADLRAGTQPRPAYSHHPEHEYTRDIEQNVFERLNETLVSAGLPEATLPIQLYSSVAEREQVNQWMADKQLDPGSYALMHPGSSPGWPSKRWPEKYFGRLAVMLEEKGIRCVWAGGPAEQDLSARLSAHAGIDGASLPGLIQLYLLGLKARFAVTNDSGPMHVLSLSDIPVYAFFGPSSWVRSHAAGQKSRVFKSTVDCSPCFSGRCPTSKKHACLNQITPEMVFRKIQTEILSNQQN